MPEPVLVVHGVANRSWPDFAAQVARLAQALGGPWDLIPVFWGDLGATADAVADTIPTIDWPWVRAEGEEVPPVLVGELLAEVPGAAAVHAADAQQETVARAVEESLAAAPAMVVRGPDATALREAVREQWPATRFLKEVGDPRVLARVGRVLAAAARESPAAGPAGTPAGPYGTAAGPYETRVTFSGLKKLVQAVLEEMDHLLGEAVGDTLGAANQKLRRASGVRLGEFLGDVFVYQRHRKQIQQRLWDAIQARAPGYGTPERPINAVGHSLGGVVIFDTAVADRPVLWLKALVTFGSQSSFFHVLDRRDNLDPYTHGLPVQLPPSVGRWTNLWEPMDLLAFLAAPVFRLHDGAPPRDVPVIISASRLAEARLWTHSVYWDSDDLVRALRETLAG